MATRRPSRHTVTVPWCPLPQPVPSPWVLEDLSPLGLEDPEPTLPEADQVNGLLDVLVNIAEGESFLAYRRLRAVWDIVDLVLLEAGEELAASQESEMFDPYRQAAARVATALRISRAASEKLVAFADAGTNRVPALLSQLRDGRLTPMMFETCVRRVELVSVEHIDEVDYTLAETLGGVGALSQRRTEAIVDRVVYKIDPDADRHRRDRAELRKDARVKPIDDGLASLMVIASAEDAALAMGAVEALVDACCDHDPRSKRARRAAAAIARLRGLPFTCACERDDCTATLDDDGLSTAQAKIVLYAICDSSTLAGGDEPGYLDGHGVLSAEHVRDIAQRDETIVRPVDLADLIEPAAPVAPVDTSAEASDPPPGARQRPRPDNPDARLGEETRPEPEFRISRTALPSDPYRPTTTTAVIARFLFGTCTTPGCTRPAWRCDLDHVEEFDQICPDRGGPTCLCNLNPKCRHHHLQKTHGRTRIIDGSVGAEADWRVESWWCDDQFVDENGDYWTSTTTPEGYTVAQKALNQWLFPGLGRLRCPHIENGVRVSTTSSAPAPRRAQTRTEAKHAWRRAHRARNRRRSEAEAIANPPPF
ncbi:HNH endonuclease [Gordonia alkaliphila]|uniref:DUF222 domain-containing protein n=1 Tax=Gordonia alkaliphila TaxID=1053547 RepID=A0ABP8YWE9_9ACTN|nr:HNH endonuclease signature motif containing protein [Gordonia alkaliphila]MCK0440654.1 HNH endonuclease [Gordonia alkaliphila]